jgi:hypothetical protein
VVAIAGKSVQAVVPVSSAGAELTQALTDTQLRASAVPVTATPATKTLTQISGSTATSGDQTLVAAPAAGSRIVVTAFVVQNASATASTAKLINGSAGVGWWCLGQNQGDGLAMSFAPGAEWRLTAATALVLNLSGANAHYYSISYFVEAV